MMQTTIIRAILVLSMIAGSVSAPAAIVTKTNSTADSFDESSGYRDVTFSLSDFAGDPTIVLDVDVSIRFRKSVVDPVFDPVAHFDEIEFVLISPLGTQFTLISNSGGIELVPADVNPTFDVGYDGLSFDGTVVFDQSAADPVDLDPYSIPSGAYRPDDDTLNSLDLFIGEDAVGTWRLFIEDDLGPLDPFFDPPSPLEFLEFSLTIQTASASSHPIPEPASLWIFGVVIGAVAASRLRNAKCKM